MEENAKKKIYWIYPTRACNLSCSYCVQSTVRKEKKTDSALFMTRETAYDLIRFIMQDEPEKEKQVQFFGGEPMLAFDIVKYITPRLKEKIYSPLKFSMTTNGTLLDGQSLEWLKENGFSIAVSVDGPPEVTRKSRPGSEKADIKLIHEYFPNAQIIMTLSQVNITDAFKSTVWFIEEMGFQSVAHNLVVESEWPEEAQREHDRFAERLADYYIKKYDEGKNVGFMMIGFGAKCVRGAMYRGPRWICGSNPGLLAIDANGDIYPCQEMVLMDREKNYKIGDIRGGYIPPKSIPLEVMKFERREDCRKCSAYHLCVGGCGPKNLYICGDRYKPIQAGCGLYAKQVMEATRALMLTGQLLLNDRGNEHRERERKLQEEKR